MTLDFKEVRSIKKIIVYLDDLLVALGLISFVTASYMINAILGTYVLGIAFLIAAYFTGVALQSPMVQQIINRFQKRK